MTDDNYDDEDNGSEGVSTPHDNDADGRPRVYMRSATRDGEVEVTVKGAEGESTEDVATHAEDRFEQAVNRQGEIASDDADTKGFD